METPKQTYKRLLIENEYLVTDIEYYDLDINFLEKYHKERLKIKVTNEKSKTRRK